MFEGEGRVSAGGGVEERWAEELQGIWYGRSVGWYLERCAHEVGVPAFPMCLALRTGRRCLPVSVPWCLGLTISV